MLRLLNKKICNINQLKDIICNIFYLLRTKYMCVKTNESKKTSNLFYSPILVVSSDSQEFMARANLSRCS